MPNDLYDQEILPLYEYAEVPVPESVLLDTEHRFPSFLSAMREGNITLPKNILRDILSIYDPVRHDGMDIDHYVDVIRYVHKSFGMCGNYGNSMSMYQLYTIMRILRTNMRHTRVEFSDQPQTMELLHHSLYRSNENQTWYIRFRGIMAHRFCLHDSYKLILELMSAIGIIHHVPSYRLTERGEACYRILRYAYRHIRQEDPTLFESTCDQ